MEILHNGVSPFFFINPQKLRLELEFEYIIIGGRKKQQIHYRKKSRVPIINFVDQCKKLVRDIMCQFYKFYGGINNGNIILKFNTHFAHNTY